MERRHEDAWTPPGGHNEEEGRDGSFGSVSRSTSGSESAGETDNCSDVVCVESHLTGRELHSAENIYFSMSLNPKNQVGRYSKKFILTPHDRHYLTADGESEIEHHCQAHQCIYPDARNASCSDVVTEHEQIHIDSSSPIEIFQRMLDEGLLHKIVVWMNSRNIHGHDGTSTTHVDTTLDEMKRFLGLCILMGNIKFPSLRRCWSTSEFYSHPIFERTMSKKRFETLLRSLCFHDDHTYCTASDHHNINDILESVLVNFARALTPSTSSSSDRSLVLWNGKILLRHVANSRKQKSGMRLYDLCTSDGYILKVVYHTGKGSLLESTKGLVFEAVTRLMEDRVGQSKSKFMGVLFAHLDVRGALAGRQGMVINVNLQRSSGDHPQYGDVVVEKSNDMRNGLVVSTTDDESRHTEPYMVVYYERLVDLRQHSTPHHSMPKKNLKWCVKLFFHLVDASLWNGALLYSKIKGARCNHLEFRDAILGHFINRHSIHLVAIRKHNIVKNAKRLRCRVCFRNGKRTKVTFFSCNICNDNKGRKIGLCPAPCFAKWHDQ